MWGRVYDLETEEPIMVEEFPSSRLPPEHPLLAHGSDDDAITGILSTDRGALLVASQPILTSEDEGPSRGALIMDRFLTKDLVEIIAEQVRVDFRLWSIPDDEVPVHDRPMLERLTPGSPPLVSEQDEKMLRVYSVMNDIEGRPAVLLRADVPRHISARGAEILRGTNLFGLTAGILTLLLFMTLLHLSVLGPLKKLTAHATALGRNDDLTARLSFGRKDDLGTLAREFDSMVEKLSLARKGLLEKSYESGKAEIALRVLHGVRNALSPVVGHLGLLRSDLKGMPLEQIRMAKEELAQEMSSPARRQDLGQFLDLATEKLLSHVEKSEKSLDEIWKHAQKVEQILASNDEISRAERPEEHVKLEGIVRDAVREIPADLRERISVEIDAGVNGMPPVKGDRISLKQILSHLLINAAESIRRTGSVSGGVMVRASTERMDGAEVIHVQVQDNGAGIPRDDLDRIFQRGYSTKPGDTSGLGLHWCANTISSMEGKLYAESDGAGHGARLHLFIPNKTAQIPRVDPRRSRRSPPCSR